MRYPVQVANYHDRLAAMKFGLVSAPTSPVLQVPTRRPGHWLELTPEYPWGMEWNEPGLPEKFTDEGFLEFWRTWNAGGEPPGLRPEVVVAGIIGLEAEYVVHGLVAHHAPGPWKPAVQPYIVGMLTYGEALRRGQAACQRGEYRYFTVEKRWKLPPIADPADALE